MKSFTLKNVIISYDEMPDAKISLLVRFGNRRFQIFGTLEKLWEFCDSVTGYAERISDAEVESLQCANSTFKIVVLLSDYIYPQMNSEFIDELLEMCEKFNLSVAG